MTRPTLEVAGIIRAQGERFMERSRSWLTWPQTKVLHSHHALPHRGSGRPSRSLYSLWLSGHLLQLVPYGKFLLMGSQVVETTRGAGRAPFRLSIMIGPSAGQSVDPVV